ncbi:GyrI-like domain-containing protein [Rhodopseudomonas sp. B29]|uniref:GyrI-like domain-containing protein n=1 Tax=Rhodopseudomonas sp. B29 TaxID=95607 RepID=UPI00034DE5B9|nr:GyrI-like domain-containing protein [Rhodopseudomonas sp. B29]
MKCPRPHRLARLGLIAAVATSLGIAGSSAQTTSDKPAETAAPAASQPAAPTPAPAPTSSVTPAAPAAPDAAATPAPATPPATSASPAPAATPAPATPPATTASPAPPAAPAPVQSADPFGEETTLTAKPVLILKGKADWDNAFDTLMESFRTLSGWLAKQGVTPNGNPMIVYTSTDDNGFTFQAEYPVPEAPKALGKNMSMGQSPDGKALKFVHRGSYDNMDNTYEAITNYLDDKKIEAKDTFIEEYVTDPLKTTEDKLVTNVFVPMK